MARVCLVSNTDYSLYYFRKGLIKALCDNGYDVHIGCPHGNFISELAKIGVKHHQLMLDRRGLNPFVELRTLWQLYMIFKRERFDLVQTFTIKPNIYGNIAGWFARVPCLINTVTGLGYVFIGGGKGKALLRKIVVILLRLAFKMSGKVIFLNNDDLQFYKNYKIVDDYKGIIIKGEGVDTKKFSSDNLDKEKVEQLLKELDLDLDRQHSRIVVTIISRMLWDKGIREFTEAAKMLKQKYSDILFLMVGPIDTGNPSAVPREFIDRAVSDGTVKYLGERSDIAEILYVTDVVTLPSYREGIPLVLLEAMSMGKPVVTTNVAGCRDVVEEGKSGLITRLKSPQSLAEALQKLIIDKELRINMGEYGRRKALAEFEEGLIVSQILRNYEELLISKSVIM